MSMMITYEVKNSLYLNITNRCTNNCTFCIRNKADGVGTGSNLWLDREPTVAEIVEDIQKRDLSKYYELVFCGFGEPMLRTPDIIAISKIIKEKSNIRIRINTNGQANMIFNRDVTPPLEGLVDAVHISLNAADNHKYQALCQSVYGELAYEAILGFASCCQKHVPEVVFTVVDILSAEDIQACEKTARELGIDFKVRYFIG